MDLNLYMCIGTITHDVEINRTDKGHAVCNFNLHVEEREIKKDGEEFKRNLYIRVVAWKKLAEKYHIALIKGARVLVTGNLVYREFDTKEGKRKTFEVIATNIQVL